MLEQVKTVFDSNNWVCTFCLANWADEASQKENLSIEHWPQQYDGLTELPETI